jgi:hypothetical protein
MSGMELSMLVGLKVFSKLPLSFFVPLNVMNCDFLMVLYRCIVSSDASSLCHLSFFPFWLQCVFAARIRMLQSFDHLLQLHCLRD